MGKLINRNGKLFRRTQMEFLIIALVLIVGVYFGWQYYQAKKAVIDPYLTKVASEAKEAAKKVDVEKVLDVNKDGKVDMQMQLLLLTLLNKLLKLSRKLLRSLLPRRRQLRSLPLRKSQI